MRLQFDGFEIDPEEGRLLRNGVEVPLERRSFEMLCYLARHPGRLIEKQELLSHVWQVRSLSRGVLASTLAKLRKALGQAADQREPIETVHGRGYRFHGIAQRAQARPTHESEAVPASRASGARPFVGRKPALEKLTKALEQAACGQGQLLLLVGDAGIGKTRMLEELSPRAQQHGFSIWEGTAHDGAGAPPYWPWVEILRKAQQELPAPKSHVPADCAALGLLWPELVENGVVADAGDPSTRFRLFDELSRFLGSASKERPRLIVIDDLHWADAATIELLAYAARVLAKHALLFVATLRGHEPTDETQAGALRRLGRGATRVRLRGLDLSEVGELVHALEPLAQADAPVIEALFQRTQGNPFFICQLVELLSQDGRSPDVAQLAALELPAAVRDVIQRRIAALGEPSQSVLGAAAVIGLEFELPLLAEILDASPEAVLSALEPARRAGIVTRHASRPERFSFAHALLRETLYEQLELARSGALHAKLARTLSARPSGRDPRQLGEIARHYLLAVPCELDACVLHCRKAAAAARAASGFEAAAELLSRALDKLESEGGSQRTASALLQSLAIDQVGAGAMRACVKTLERSAEIARRIGDVHLLARSAYRLAGWVELGGIDEAVAQGNLDQALSLLGHDQAGQRAALLARSAEVGFDLPLERRLALLDEADQLASASGEADAALAAAFARVNLRHPTRLEEGRAAIAHFWALLKRHPDSLDDAHAAHARWLWPFQIELADYARALTACDLTSADEALTRCRAIAEASHMVPLDLALEAVLAGRALGDGRLDDLERHVARLRLLRESFDAPRLTGMLADYYAIQLAEARGNGQVFASLFAALPRTLPELPAHRRVRLSAMLAAACAKAGAHDQARGFLADLPPAELARMPALAGDLDILAGLVEICRELGDSDRAQSLYHQLAPYAELNVVGAGFDYRGSVAHYLGILASLLGRNAQARAHFRRAEEVNAKLNMPLQLANTRALHAQAALLGCTAQQVPGSVVPRP